MTNPGWKERIERFWRTSFQVMGLVAAERLAVDLGTANTRVYLPESGVVINEPSVIALNAESRKVASVGREAKTLARRQPRSIRIVRPVKDGVIIDSEAAGQMLAQFIGLALARRSTVKPSLLICVSAGITPLEQRSYEDAARRAGAGKITLIEEPYAAAEGAELNPRAPGVSMVLDLGAGTMDIAVIGDGGVLYASTRRVGGDEIDQAIIRHLHQERALEVTEETAEEIKIGLGAVDSSRNLQEMVVRGRNLTTGLPEEVTVLGEEIYPLIQPTLRMIKQHAQTALEEIPTAASVDLLDSGILLTGGLSQLHGLAEHLGREFGLHACVAPEPMLAAALGAGRLLQRESDASIQGAWRISAGEAKMSGQ